jgi:hypothetical protein
MNQRDKNRINIHKVDPDLVRKGKSRQLDSKQNICGDYKLCCCKNRCSAKSFLLRSQREVWNGKNKKVLVGLVGRRAGRPMLDSPGLPRQDLKGGYQLRSPRRPLNLICIGLAVLWFFGPLARRFFGFLGQWSIGPVSQKAASP